jgi:hypothetical protein
MHGKRISPTAKNTSWEAIHIFLKSVSNRLLFKNRQEIWCQSIVLQKQEIISNIVNRKPTKEKNRYTDLK